MTTKLGSARFCIANLLDGSCVADRQIGNMAPKIPKGDIETISEMVLEV